ncbi:MAG: hypothetical protein KGQ49_05735, partial [Verrucomicrobia bacterium]|nr:hypothetical protein [Verrucomicrobiota bacterium]
RIQDNCVAIQATPSQGQTWAELRRTIVPHAVLTADEDKELPNSLQVYATVNGRRIKSRVGQKDQEWQEATKKVWELGLKIIRKWDRTVKAKDIEVGIGNQVISVNHIPKFGHDDFKKKIEEIIKKQHPNASHFQMDFSDDTLRFLENGKTEAILKDNLPEEVKEILEFLHVWDQTHDKAMELLGLQSWHTRLDFDSNRPIHGEVPFKLKNDHWERYIPKTDEEFFNDSLMRTNHFKDLTEELPPELRGEAEGKIRKTSSFVQAMKEKIEAKIAEKQSDSTQDWKKEIEVLEKIKKQLAEMDLLATYTAVAFWEDTDQITDQLLSEKAQAVTNARMSIFKKTRNISDEKWKTPSLNWLQPVPDANDLKSQADQTGSLYFHSDLEYLNRCKSSGTKRMSKASMEEFVVNNWKYRNDPNYVDDLYSFGLQTPSPTFQAELRDLIRDARQNTIST